MLTYDRTFALDDIEITRSGDGRTVEAYAAVFDVPTEVVDQHGHYLEVIDRGAFTRTLSHGIDRVGVFYNHGVNPTTGKPDGLLGVPIARALEVKADARGLRTVSRYNRGPVADAVLESIRNGEIKGQSFRGRVFRSSPDGKVPRRRPGAPLPTVVRHELGLTEFGPTPRPVYEGAGILAVRSADQLAAELAALDDDARAELIRALTAATPEEGPAADPATPAPGPGAEASLDPGHAGRISIARARIALATRMGARTQ